MHVAGLWTLQHHSIIYLSPMNCHILMWMPLCLEIGVGEKCWKIVLEKAKDSVQFNYSTRKKNEKKVCNIILISHII
jgi:hypothetical protein